MALLFLLPVLGGVVLLASVRMGDNADVVAPSSCFFVVDAFQFHNNNNHLLIPLHANNDKFFDARRFRAPSSSSSSLQLSVADVDATSSSSVDAIRNNDDDANSTITTTIPHLPLLPQAHIRAIRRGGVATLPNWLPPHLVSSLRQDAQRLFESGYFRPDGLTNTAVRSRGEEQGFTAKDDRQTYRGGAGWYDAAAGNIEARLEFADRMDRLRKELAVGLERPTLLHNYNDVVVRNDVAGGGSGGATATTARQQRHEITYNWYEPGAKLGRHLDEHHEETKGTKGWILPSRRSVTWLVYLNENWEEEEGGALRCFPRSEAMMELNGDVAPVGAHEGNLQVGWVNGGVDPVFLDCFRPSGMASLYQLVLVPTDEGKEREENDNIIIDSDCSPTTTTTTTMVRERRILSVKDFDVPSMPIEFASFLTPDVREHFTQISTSRQVASSSAPSSSETVDFDCSNEKTILDVMPAAGTLVLFDSVSLPHLVREVTGTRQRIAATGWFHEDSQFVLEV